MPHIDLNLKAKPTSKAELIIFSIDYQIITFITLRLELQRGLNLSPLYIKIITIVKNTQSSVDSLPVNCYIYNV